MCACVCARFWWDSISSQVLGRIKLKLGGMVEGMLEAVLMKEYFDRFEFEGDQVPLLGHGMTKRPQIGHDGTSGQEMTNDELDQCLGQVCGPQVPL